MPENNPLKIVVPTDFSECALRALEFAVLLARQKQAKLLVLHVYMIPFLPVRGAYYTDTEKGQQNQLEADEKLRLLVHQLGGLADIDVELKSTPMYGPIEIPGIIRSQAADIIIMGTRGADGLKKWIIGTNTASVIESAVCPVLIIPEEADCRPISNIAFAYDGQSIGNLDNLKSLLGFAKVFSAGIHVFHVTADDLPVPENQQIETDRILEYLEPCLISFELIRGPVVQDVINNVIEEKEIQILAMLPRSKSLLERLFKGSMTRRMLYQVKTGLLVLPG